MANIAASDITVTVLNNRKRDDGFRVLTLQLAFGDGALTYPAGGVPISKSVLGCPNIIDSLKVFDKGTSGYEWSYDRANEKLVALQSPVHTHSFLVKGGQAAASTDAISIKGSAPVVIGKEAATDNTALGGTNGGVQNNTGAALEQPSTVAIAAQTLKVEVIGW